MQPSRSVVGKLGRLVVVSVLIALTLGSAASLWLEVRRYGEQKRERLLAVAHAFAAASAEAVAAHDRDAIFEAVRAIGQLPGITHVSVADGDGMVLEEVGSGVQLVGHLVLDETTPLSLTAVLFSRTAIVGVPVRHRGVEVGRLELTSETGDLWGRLLVVLAFALGAAVVASAIGLAIAWRLQRAITRPLLTLTATMSRVREAHDYDEACPVESDDEIGQLALGFNAMLGEIRRRDARLAQHRERLESEVEERTRDLATAKDAAERASSAKSDFLATMSHEIRTPMNGMLVMAELLAAGDLPERQRRYAEVIARSGQSLLAIINDILDFAKVEAGKLELEAAPVDLGEAVETVVTLFGERAAGKGLDLAAAVDPALPRIVGDPVRLTQVVANLVNNALKFTETGHVLVRVAAADGRVTIRVEDTGIGIPEEKRATIFSAFSQADQSTTRRFGGTGLGLSIVQRLVAAMGGAIRVESVVGEGSCFIVELPCIPVEGETPAPPRLDAPRAAVVAAAGAATRAALSVGLVAAGFDLRDPETAEPGEIGPDADWIVDADALLRDGRPAGARRVLALSPIGERAGEEARARGLADALLRRPLAPSEWTVALVRLVDGTPFPREETARDGAAAALPRFTGARVLVADDSAVNREVACEALSRLGIAARTVANGREALEAIVAGGIDLVLMDGSMPELDGFEATRLARAREAGSGAARTPIVALTAHVVGAGADAWREAGMDGVLHKPFTLAALAQALGAHLPATEPVPATHDAAPAEAPPAPAAEAESDPAALLDEEVVAGIAEMSRTTGAGFLRRILGLYLEHAPPALAQLAAAVAEGAEPAQVASAAHALKSMSLNVGAAALATRLAAIEAAARETGTLPDAAALDALAPLLGETIAALRARLGADEPQATADAAVAAAG